MGKVSLGREVEDTFHRRLKLALDERHISTNEVAASLKTTASTVSRWKNETIPDVRFRQGLEDLLGVSWAWLMGHGSEKVPMMSVQALDEDAAAPKGIVKVPEYRVSFCCGNGTAEPSWEEANDVHAAFYRSQFFRNNMIEARNCKRIKATGDSMLPTIMSDDFVLIDTSEEATGRIQQGAIYAFSDGDQLMIKRIRKDGGRVYLISDNPTYKPIEMTEAEAAQRITIMGRVIERSGVIK